MSLKERIETDIKNAMRAKQQDELRALRAIKSQILLAATEKGAAENLTEAEEMQLLNKAAKQRKDSLEIYKKENRTDLAEKEEQELLIIERYLPKQLSEEEVKETVSGIISELNAGSMQDMGKVMGVATKKLAGRADNKTIASVVKSLLA
jgi:uncharacterized protein